MRNYILDLMRKGEHGLFLCELPTGYGKTFNVVQALKDYAMCGNPKRKIFYLTTMNKNLPEDQLREAFEGDQLKYDNFALRIRVNLDEVLEKIDSLEVPEEYRGEKYRALTKRLKLYQRRKGEDPDFDEKLEAELRKLEYDFRKEIQKSIKHGFPNEAMSCKRPNGCEQ